KYVKSLIKDRIEDLKLLQRSLVCDDEDDAKNMDEISKQLVIYTNLVNSYRFSKNIYIPDIELGYIFYNNVELDINHYHIPIKDGKIIELDNNCIIRDRDIIDHYT